MSSEIFKRLNLRGFQVGKQIQPNYIGLSQLGRSVATGQVTLRIPQVA